MADLSIDFCGIKSPNPFWLASAPPANSGDQVMRAFDAGWGGAVWKTLGNPIVNVTSRFGGIDYGSTRMMGLNNIELITDRPLEVNLREIREVKRRYPKHAVIASLMVETKEEWREIIQKAEDAGADGLELNFGCPHGMCERGMGSAVGNEPKVLEEIARWAVEFAKTPVIVKLTPNIGDITEPGEAVLRSGAHGISLINTIKSIIGIDLDRMVPIPRVGDGSTNGGYCGPAVKPIALHLLAQLARHPGIKALPISGIGGISNWRDAAEFIALGSTSVQVCTAVMHYGYRIVDDMIEGLSDFLDSKGMKSVNELRGLAVPGYQEWGDLDLSYKLIAEIDTDKCIGCQLCYVACMDGAHQCIHVPGRTEAESRKAGHTHIPKLVPDRAVIAKGGIPGSRVPFVDEEECVGCNLCQLVCPVAGCITMREESSGKPKETWNDRVQKGTDIVPGGLDATVRARAEREMTHSLIRLTAEDGHEFDAYRALPEGEARGGIVMIQEIFGVNGHIREVADEYAREGYVVLAPALFDRVRAKVDLGYTPEGTAEGRALRAEIGWDKPLLDIEAAAKALRSGTMGEPPKTPAQSVTVGAKPVGKVATIGFCWGGSLSFLTACRSDVDCAVAYYGGQIIQFVDERPKAPVMMHFGERDALIPEAGSRSDSEKHEGHAGGEIHVYAAGHGFNCTARLDYEPLSAGVAKGRTLAFLAKHLG